LWGAGQNFRPEKSSCFPDDQGEEMAAGDNGKRKRSSGGEIARLRQMYWVRAEEFRRRGKGARRTTRMASGESDSENAGRGRRSKKTSNKGGLRDSGSPASHRTVEVTYRIHRSQIPVGIERSTGKEDKSK